jgi:beta-lactamase regulating signal transducer with metallopeptidase domain
VDVVTNWLWQGCSVALVTAVLLRCLDRAPSQARYLVCWVSLSVVLVQPMISTAWLTPSPLPVLTVTTPVPVPQLSESALVPWDPLLLLLWGLWLLAHGWQVSVAMIASQRTRVQCSPFPQTLEPRLRHWTRVRQSGRQATLVVSDAVRAAGVVGCGSPIIAVAPSLLNHLNVADLDRVILHEWAHVQRRDDLANLLQVIVRTVAGWHPAVWWLERRLRAERENACDEMTTMQTGSAKAYAECLVKIAALAIGRHDVVPTLGALSSTSVVRRVRRIISHKDHVSSSWSTAGAMGAIALLLGMSLVVGSLRFVEAVAVSAEIDARPAFAQSMPGQMAFALPAAIVSVPASRVRAGMRQRASAPGRDTTGLIPQIAIEETRSEESHDVLPATGVPLAPHDAAVSAKAPDALLLSTQIPVPAAERVTPWAAAADAGIALGQRSKEGGRATAAFFTRLGKRVADSF